MSQSPCYILILDHLVGMDAELNLTLLPDSRNLVGVENILLYVMVFCWSSLLQIIGLILF